MDGVGAKVTGKPAKSGKFGSMPNAKRLNSPELLPPQVHAKRLRELVDLYVEAVLGELARTARPTPHALGVLGEQVLDSVPQQAQGPERLDVPAAQGARGWPLGSRPAEQH